MPRPDCLTATLAALSAAVLLAAGCTPGGQATGGNPTPTGEATTPTPTASVVPTTPVPAPSDPVCGDTAGWRTGKQEKAILPVSEEVYQVAVGQHPSCDRVRFDVNTPADVGYTVRYVDRLTSDPQGEPIETPRGSILQVVIQAPDFGTSGHQPWRTPWGVGDVIIERDGWPAFVNVTFAGSFENVSTYGIVVAGPKRPFRVWDRQYSSVRQIVVDIAHA